MDVDTAITYLDFVVERHRVWDARQVGAPQPWTDDPVLRTRKFTNVYRVLDPGSQFVLTDLALPGDHRRDVLARIFLYRYTNLPATWLRLRDALGHYPTEADILRGEEVIGTMQAIAFDGGKVFSGAYVILPQPNRPGNKIVQAVELAARWMANHATDFLLADTQQERYDILRSEYGVGPFLAMQILTDWGYTPQCGEDREDQFIIPGPGCIKGAKAIAPSAPVMDTLLWCHREVNNLDGMPALRLPDLDGRVRRPSLMDVQNTLCEFSKYVRGPRAGEYVPAHPGPQPAPVLPSHW
jgi:hypothetical protein